MNWVAHTAQRWHCVRERFMHPLGVAPLMLATCAGLLARAHAHDRQPLTLPPTPLFFSTLDRIALS